MHGGGRFPTTTSPTTNVDSVIVVAVADTFTLDLGRPHHHCHHVSSKLEDDDRLLPKEGRIFVFVRATEKRKREGARFSKIVCFDGIWTHTLVV